MNDVLLHHYRDDEVLRRTCEFEWLVTCGDEVPPLPLQARKNTFNLGRACTVPSLSLLLLGFLFFVLLAGAGELSSSAGGGERVVYYLSFAPSIVSARSIPLKFRAGCLAIISQPG